MDKIKNNYPMILLGLVTIRMLMPEASISLALFGLGIITMYGYKTYIDSKFTKTLDETVREELSNMKSHLTGLTVKNNLKTGPKDGQKWF